jgi:hypothetical protein
MSKKFTPPHKASGPIRPKAPVGHGYHPGRAIHGNASVHTVETKTAPKAPKAGSPHTKKFKAS